MVISRSLIGDGQQFLERRNRGGIRCASATTATAAAQLAVRRVERSHAVGVRRREVGAVLDEELRDVACSPDAAAACSAVRPRASRALTSAPASSSTCGRRERVELGAELAARVDRTRAQPDGDHQRRRTRSPAVDRRARRARCSTLHRRRCRRRARRAAAASCRCRGSRRAPRSMRRLRYGGNSLSCAFGFAPASSRISIICEARRVVERRAIRPAAVRQRVEVDGRDRAACGPTSPTCSRSRRLRASTSRCRSARSSSALKQRRDAVGIREVDVGACSDERLRALEAALARRVQQRREAAGRHVLLRAARP